MLVLYKILFNLLTIELLMMAFFLVFSERLKQLNPSKDRWAQL